MAMASFPRKSALTRLEQSEATVVDSEGERGDSCLVSSSLVHLADFADSMDTFVEKLPGLKLQPSAFVGSLCGDIHCVKSEVDIVVQVKGAGSDTAEGLAGSEQVDNQLLRFGHNDHVACQILARVGDCVKAGTHLTVI